MGIKKGKPEFRKGARIWDTKWIGKGPSITQGDYFVLSANGRYDNETEFKKRAPFLTQAQLRKFEKGEHVVIYENSEKNEGKLPRSFEADWYDFYCPYKDWRIKYEKSRKSWLLIQKPTTIEKPEAKRVFRAEAPFPCCGRFSGDRKMDRSR